MKNKFVYAIACDSAANLGHDAVRLGASGYIGFNCKLWIIINAQNAIGKCFINGIKNILANKTAADTRQSMVTEFNTIIETLKNHQKYKSVTHNWLITALSYNRDGIVHLGDPNWHLNKIIPKIIT